MHWHHRGQWPCKWISIAETGPAPFVIGYRRLFTLDRDATFKIHVTADERYELYLDGNVIGRGSERGDMYNWFYETYELTLPAGDHSLVAKTWMLGSGAPAAQMSVFHGFLCSAEDEFISIVGSGVADWQAKRITGISFTPCEMSWGGGKRNDIDGFSYPWGFETGAGDGWEPVITLDHGADGSRKNVFRRIHQLTPAMLPPMLSKPVPSAIVRHVEEPVDCDPLVLPERNLDVEHDGWERVLHGEGLRIPANTARRVILDFNEYYCAYPLIKTSGGGGATITVKWAEGLYEKEGKISGGGETNAARKGNRNEINGKRFIGVGSNFRPDGGRERLFRTLWWESGRFVEIVVKTANEEMVLESLSFLETRYPLEPESEMSCDDARWAGIGRMSLRGLQMCSHETFFDCPYYEQLMYAGDTRVQALVTYSLATDARLQRKALRMFDASRINSRGLTCSCYPSPTAQIIPPFSLMWTLMVHDYSLWRGEASYVIGLMPGVRSVLETFIRSRNEQGLVKAQNGWNFVDWVPDWKDPDRGRNWGVPPGGDQEVNGLLQSLVILALRSAADVEQWLGENELAARYRRIAHEISTVAKRVFWDCKRKLFSENPDHRHFSEHSQCLAILGGTLEPQLEKTVAESLVEATDIARTTIYFTHYLFEAFAKTGHGCALFNRLDLWYDLESNGLKTTIEEPEPSRSDCHGWGAHPLYHFYTTILGIRPSSMGFSTVEIRPQLGKLLKASGSMAHPSGKIEVVFEIIKGKIHGVITLPAGLSGKFIFGDVERALHEGKQTVTVDI